MVISKHTQYLHETQASAWDERAAAKALLKVKHSLIYPNHGPAATEPSSLDGPQTGYSGSQCFPLIHGFAAPTAILGTCRKPEKEM